jgi:alpha-tubulin suppressor-like RCC1 family protein
MLYGIPIVDVSAGGWHSLFLAEDGSAYSCGDNRYGQLGHGHATNTPVPRKLACPAGSVMASVAAGLYHTLLLSKNVTSTDIDVKESTCVWACGWNHYGQLGVSFMDSDHACAPRPLLAFQSMRPSAVVCGNYHSMFLTSGGDVWTWGRGDYGQLGHGVFKHEPEPRLLESVSKVHWIVSAAGGERHTIINSEHGGT